MELFPFHPIEANSTLIGERTVLQEKDPSGGRQIEVRLPSCEPVIVTKRIIHEGILIEILLKKYRSMIKALKKEFNIREFFHTQKEVEEALNRRGGLMEAASCLSLEGRNPVILPLTPMNRQKIFEIISRKMRVVCQYNIDDDTYWGRHRKRLPITVVEGAHNRSIVNKYDSELTHKMILHDWNGFREGYEKLFSDRGMHPIHFQVWLHLIMVMLSSREIEKFTGSGLSNILNGGGRGEYDWLGDIPPAIECSQYDNEILIKPYQLKPSYGGGYRGACFLASANE